jgi:membrane associated rhomboid family serine protease
MSVTIIILVITALVSYQAFSNYELFTKLQLNPWSVKHKKEYYRILSHTLIHADWGHLILNMFVFYSFGTFLESVFTNPLVFRDAFPSFNFWGIQFGYIAFIGLYIVGAAIASIPAMKKHSDNYAYNAVGASGAVSAMLMAFMIMFPLHKVSFFFFFPLPAYIAAPVFFLMEHYMQKRGRTNVAHDAHIWGALAGILYVFILNPQFLVRFITVVRNSIF